LIQKAAPGRGCSEDAGRSRQRNGGRSVHAN
jgi:hypothetical protein